VTARNELGEATASIKGFLPCKIDCLHGTIADLFLWYFTQEQCNTFFLNKDETKCYGMLE